MSDQDETINASTPWHLWAVGVTTLLWNSGGAYDYFMTQTKNEAYMSAFSAEELAFFYGFPAWVDATWAIAVWGGLLGSLLLLFRSRYAVWAFAASLAAMVITTFQNYVLSNGMEVMGSAFALVFTIAIFLIALGLFLYSRAMLGKKILK